MNFLVSAWYKKSPWLKLLTPVSWLYQGVSNSKRCIYQRKLIKTKSFPIPIVVVGNITVGGTGKTPLIIELARILKENGYTPGIVSRGYGGKLGDVPHLVSIASDPNLCGDEPVLLARRSQCPVVICKKRVQAIEKLLELAPNCDVILSDDGMQHYAMRRDIEIAMVDGVRRFGNNLCLPAGPLREPVARLKSVDFIVNQGGTYPHEFAMQLVNQKIYNLYDTKAVFTQEAAVHAVAGIGNPQRFFQHLRNLGFNIIEHVFPDHHRFQPHDIDFGKNSTVLMTEKDAVKCVKFADARHWCVAVTATCDAEFIKLFLERLAEVSRFKH